MPCPRGLTPTSSDSEPSEVGSAGKFCCSEGVKLRSDNTFSTFLIFEGVSAEQSFLFKLMVLGGVKELDYELSGFSDELEKVWTDL